MEMTNEKESKLYEIRFIVGPGMTEQARGVQMLKDASSVMPLAAEDVWSPRKVAYLVTQDLDAFCIFGRSRYTQRLPPARESKFGLLNWEDRLEVSRDGQSNI
jgi:hypothetical protein